MFLLPVFVPDPARPPRAVVMPMIADLLSLVAEVKAAPARAPVPYPAPKVMIVVPAFMENSSSQSNTANSS